MGRGLQQSLIWLLAASTALGDKNAASDTPAPTPDPFTQASSVDDDAVLTAFFVNSGIYCAALVGFSVLARRENGNMYNPRGI